MRKTLMVSLIAAVAMPAAIVPATADAQSNREVRRDYRDYRDAQRDLNRAERRGDRRDVREARRDVREARRDLNRSVNQRDRRDRRWGRDDWRGYRNQNRALYARGNWRAPFRYQNWRPGARIAPSYYGQRYWVNNPGRYRLPPAGRHQRWVRHYNDVVLIDHRRGVVIDVIRGFYW